MSEIVETPQGSRYTDEDRRNAALHYLLNGNDSRTAKATGIPRSTIAEWRKHDWWVSLIGEVRQQADDEITAKLGRVLDKAHDELLDRLENGDVHVSRGEVVRAPVKARDAALIASIAYDKRRLQNNQPTSITSRSAQEDALKGLADYLRQIARDERDKREKIVSDQ